MPIRVLKKDKDKKEEQKEKPKSGSSVKDIFKSYGKYDGKPIELKSGGLTGGRKKLDKNKDGKITGEDFKMMRKGYGAARTSGMGLEDESIKPGKVQKAGLGKMIKKIGRVIGFGGKKAATATPDHIMYAFGPDKGMGGMLPKLLQKAIDDGIVKGASKGRMMKASKGGGADTGRLGDLKSKIYKYSKNLKKKPGLSPEDKQRIIDLMKSREPKQMQPLAKKMGGGMMQKYQTGGSVMARGCKLGRKKATKLY